MQPDSLFMHSLSVYRERKPVRYHRHHCQPSNKPPQNTDEIAPGHQRGKDPKEIQQQEQRYETCSE